MSDSIDESEAPDQSEQDDPFGPPNADEKATEPVEVEASAPSEPDPVVAASSSVFTSGFETPGEPISPEPAADPASVEAAASGPASSPPSTVSPYELEMSEPPAPADPAVASYRPSPPIERAVRPLEPYMTESPRVFAEPPPRREPTRPYYASKQPEEKSSRPWPMALLAMASGLLGALFVLGGLAIGGVFDEDPVPSTTTVAPAAAVTVPPETVIVREVIAPEGSEGVAAAVGQKVVPSIVTVEVGTGDAVPISQLLGRVWRCVLSRRPDPHQPSRCRRRRNESGHLSRWPHLRSHHHRLRRADRPRRPRDTGCRPCAHRIGIDNGAPDWRSCHRGRQPPWAPRRSLFDGWCRLGVRP